MLVRLASKDIPDRDRVRPFHDARHAAVTHLALTPGASELVLMATAGPRWFATTKRYLHLAGRAFPEAAAALEDRPLAGTKLYPPEPISDDPQHLRPLFMRPQTWSNYALEM